MGRNVRRSSSSASSSSNASHRQRDSNKKRIRDDNEDGDMERKNNTNGDTTRRSDYDDAGKDDTRDKRLGRSDGNSRKRHKRDRDTEVATSKRYHKKKSRRHDSEREERPHSVRKESDKRQRSSDKKRSRKKKESRHKRDKDDRHRRHRRRRRQDESSSSSSSSSSDDDSSSVDSSSIDDEVKGGRDGNNVKKKILNPRLLAKLAERGETLEEREERRAKRRAARVASHFGYTPENNPFNDPNLHDTFTWKKKEDTISDKKTKKGDGSDKKGSKSTLTTVLSDRAPNTKRKDDHIMEEIEKVRRRRQEREEHQDEMERIRAEEAKMKELANYDEWARKEEEFHLQQQRQRSAIRLLEHREQPIDVLAKNLLLFGLSSQDKANRAKVKYQERFDALSEIETSLEAELVEPHVMLHDLTLDELQTLLEEMINFRNLEREAMLAAQRDHEEEQQRQNMSNDSKSETGPSSLSSSEMIIKYWNNLITVCEEEIRQLKEEQNQTKQQIDTNANLMNDIRKLFEGKNRKSLNNMKSEMEHKISNSNDDNMTLDDINYWKTVLQQLDAHIAKEELSELHNVMLVRQLERLEKRKEELGELKEQEEKQNISSDVAIGVTDFRNEGKARAEDNNDLLPPTDVLPVGVEPDFGNLEESLGLTAEVTLDQSSVPYQPWMDRFRPRKPRYFNRVKTGYDWNKYNQTHYDHDNPPPKIVQGYKFNVFYPDLLDRTKTPQYKLEPCVGDPTNDFCILRFTAGPPYEDIAFKIINREWNRSRKRGFRCTFERGVLSLYFNFKSHWYRR